MLMVLGILASQSAFSHGPPGFDEILKVKIEKTSLNIEQVVVANHEDGQALTVATINQDLLFVSQQSAAQESSDVSNDNTSISPYRGSPTSMDRWRVDRSRFRWCSSSNLV